MLSEAKWYFALARDRFKMVRLGRSDGETTITVIIYDDLGIEVSSREERMELTPPFTCKTSMAEVLFEIGGRTHRF